MYRKVQESAVSKNTVSRCLAVRRHRVGPNQEARPVEQSPRWSRRLLLGGSRFGGGVGILFSEALNAARSVKQFLLAGEEGMAIRADFHAQHFALDGRARLKRVAAGAVHRNGMIIGIDRKSTRLNSSHSQISYAVFCLKKKKQITNFPAPHNTIQSSNTTHTLHSDTVA